jgi:arylsulfatase A-like enzyme
MPGAGRPNILYLHSHDTGRCIQPYGYAVATPHLQRLAEEGVLFRQAFSAAPTCSPSRAGLLTGQHAHATGMLGLAHRGFALDDYGRHMVHTLREVGYCSALVGVQHIAAGPDEAGVIGYDRKLATASTRAVDVARAAVGFLNAAPPQPFFLSVGFVETHRLPGGPGGFGYPPGDSRYVRPPATLPDTHATRQDLADFAVAAGVLDQGIGAVLAALEAAGLADNTLVICTTDHGPPFPGMKGTLTDRGIGVLLILRGPGGFRGGAVYDQLVSQLDLFPTLCEVVGVPPPPWLQGLSLVPLVEGRVAHRHEAIFAGSTHHAAYEPQRAVRTTRWKYIRRFGDRRRPVLPNVDDSPSKDLWVEHGWRERTVAAESLYDLVFDPCEIANLAEDPAFAQVRATLADRLERWMRETSDPLLRGPVPVPPGTIVKDPDGLSPAEPGRVERG